MAVIGPSGQTRTAAYTSSDVQTTLNRGRECKDAVCRLYRIFAHVVPHCLLGFQGSRPPARLSLARRLRAV